MNELIGGEPPRTCQPLHVARELERLEERVAVSGRPVTDARSFLEVRRARVPWKLGAGEQQALVEVVRGCDDDAGAARAPLNADLTVRPRELGAFARGPVRETVLDHCSTREQSGGLLCQRPASLVVDERQERLDISDQAVGRREPAQLLSVQALDPDAVRLASSPERIRALVPRVAPALVA